MARKLAGRYVRAFRSDRFTVTEAMVLEKVLDRAEAQGVPAEELRAFKALQRKVRGMVARTCAFAEASGAKRSTEVQHRLFPLDIRGQEQR